MNLIKTDICILGGGAAGLSVASFASQVGLKVVLCEGHKMGGDCLNFGCVPSKALIYISKIAKSSKELNMFGIENNINKIDFHKVHNHIKNSIKTIEPHDSKERFEKLGVKVIQEYGSFFSEKIITTDNYKIQAKYIVIATGSSPLIPNIKGLENINYFTNETIFNLKEKPKHLSIIGGGVIACEIGLAYANLGFKVSIFQKNKIFPMLDKDFYEIIKEHILSKNINLYENCEVFEVFEHKEIKNIIIKYKINDKNYSINSSHILVATGRKPNLKNLNIENTKIIYDKKGIKVNNKMQTNVKKIFAIGDITGIRQFTHNAGYQAGIVIQNMIFKIPSKANYKAFPYAIYSDLEIAHTGISMIDAKSQNLTILQANFTENDRAICSNQTIGMIKVAINKKNKIVGATIIGENASELISQWTIAINNNFTIKKMTSFIVPYPTLSEINKKVSGKYFLPIIYSNKVKFIAKLFMRLF